MLYNIRGDDKKATYISSFVWTENDIYLEFVNSMMDSESFQ